MINKQPHLFFLVILLVFPLLVTANTSQQCLGEEGYFYTNDKSSRNPRLGGFVSNSAFVGDGVFIAPTAAVCGSASILKSARIYGKAVVSGEAEVTDNARVYGNAKVFGTAYIGGKAKVSDHAQVSGDAIIEGSAWIRGYSQLNSGEYSMGTTKSVKPQHTIDAENKAQQLKNKAKEKAKEKERLLEVKKERKSSLKAIGYMLEQGSYYFINNKHGAKYQFSWHLESVSACAIKISLTTVKSNSNYDGTRHKTENLRTYDIFSNKTTFKLEHDRENHPSNCVSTYGRATGEPVYFCYSSLLRSIEIIDSIEKFNNKYCYK